MAHACAMMGKCHLDIHDHCKSFDMLQIQELHFSEAILAVISVGK